MKRELFRNMTLSGICKPLSMIVSYVYVPILLRYFGSSKYGVWITIMSIISWISYFDIGIGNGLRNKLTEAFVINDKDLAKRLVSSAYLIISVIVSIAILVFWLVGRLINWNRLLGAASCDENLYIIVALNASFIAISFVISLCKSVLFAIQKPAVVSLIELCIQVVNLIGVLIAYYFKPGSLLIMTMIYGCSTLFVNLIFSISLYKKNQFLSPSINCGSIATGKTLLNIGAKFFIVQVCALVLFTTDNLIVSFLYGSDAVTPYSIVNKLFMAVSGIYTAIITPIWSATTEAKGRSNFYWVCRIIKKLEIIMIPFFIIAFALFCSFKTISGIWLGYDISYERGLILYGFIYCVLTIWCNTFAQIANGLELLKMSVTVALIQAVVNIPLSILFAIVFNQKSSGVLLGTVISMTIGAIIIPIHVKKELKNNITALQ